MVIGALTNESVLRGTYYYYKQHGKVDAETKLSVPTIMDSLVNHDFLLWYVVFHRLDKPTSKT
jgi:hypothetical protein